MLCGILLKCRTEYIVNIKTTDEKGGGGGGEWKTTLKINVTRNPYNDNNNHGVRNFFLSE